MTKKNGATENFEDFNEEINAFFLQTKKNLTQEEITEVFRPLVEKPASTKKYLILLCLILLIYFTSDYTSDYISWYSLAISRIGLVKLLPFYDWTYLQNQNCLLVKSSKTTIFTPNCDLCENLKGIETLQEIHEEALIDHHFEVHRPFLVAEKSWPNLEIFMDNLSQDNLLTSFPCSIKSNLIDGAAALGKILKNAQNSQSFFLHFQNCEYVAMKIFRMATPKPSFSPHFFSPVQYNWMVWNKNYTFQNYKKIELTNSENFKIVGVIEGKLRLRLRPETNCEVICDHLELTLARDQFLVFTNFWSLEYANVENASDNLGVILELHSVL